MNLSWRRVRGNQVHFLEYYRVGPNPGLVSQDLALAGSAFSQPKTPYT